MSSRGDREETPGSAERGIETRRLILRPAVACDAAALAALADNPRIAENLARLPHPYRLADAEAFITRGQPAGGVAWAIFLKRAGDGPELVGMVSAEPRDGGAMEIGYWVGEPHWDRGFATEAAHAAVDYAFLHLGAKRIAVRCRVTNLASRRVIEKCGFQFVGQDLVRSLHFRAMMPAYHFALDRRTWESLRRWQPIRLAGAAASSAYRDEGSDGGGLVSAMK
jgi:RimJ/RimL family protein N-acetyltransferase